MTNSEVTDEQLVETTYDALSAALNSFAQGFWPVAPRVLLQVLVETTWAVAQTLVREHPERRGWVLALLDQMKLFAEADGRPQ